MKRIQLITGQRFGRLTVLKWIGGYGSKWLCRCDCGNEKQVKSSLLRNGHTRSCGCLIRETIEWFAVHNRTHGQSTSGTYRIWSGMKTRCTNRKTDKFRFYGGKGVVVCERWMHSFENFLADVGHKPGPEYSLDRFPNPRGNYEPGNVRWATRAQQHSNTIQNVWIGFMGQRMTIAGWARHLGFAPGTLYSRLGKQKWSIERALTEPTRKSRHLTAVLK